MLLGHASRFQRSSTKWLVNVEIIRSLAGRFLEVVHREISEYKESSFSNGAGGLNVA